LKPSLALFNRNILPIFELMSILFQKFPKAEMAVFSLKMEWIL
jgi:hypothetical protein